MEAAEGGQAHPVPGGDPLKLVQTLRNIVIGRGKMGYGHIIDTSTLLQRRMCRNKFGSDKLPFETRFSESFGRNIVVSRSFDLVK